MEKIRPEICQEQCPSKVTIYCFFSNSIVLYNSEVEVGSLMHELLTCAPSIMNSTYPERFLFLHFFFLFLVLPSGKSLKELSYTSINLSLNMLFISKMVFTCNTSYIVKLRKFSLLDKKLSVSSLVDCSIYKPLQMSEMSICSSLKTTKKTKNIRGG